MTCFAALTAAHTISDEGIARFRRMRSTAILLGTGSGIGAMLPIALLITFIVVISKNSNPDWSLVRTGKWVAGSALAALFLAVLAAVISELAVGRTRILNHVFPAVLCVVYYIVYSAVRCYREQQLFDARISIVSDSNGPPTLAFIFAAATFVCLLLSAVTFLLDYYRVPLLMLFSII
jgi:hypothetical protein